MILPILNVADPRDAAVLKRKSTPVAAVDERVRKLVADMLDTMYDAPGIGLAAVQVGVPERIIVMDLGERDPATPAVDEDAPLPVAQRRPRVLINPEITWRSEELFTYEEGCLSVPEVFDAVERPARCRLTWLDLDGAPREEEAEGMFAVCIQHEMDHLEGVLFIDHLSRLKRERAIKFARKSLPKDAA